MNVRTIMEEDTKSTLKLSFNLLEIDISAFIGYLRMQRIEILILILI